MDRQGPGLRTAAGSAAAAASDAQPLRIRLLGDVGLRLGDAPLPPLESARAESLLAYLLLHRHSPQQRQRLAFLLWPDSTEPQARTNLRHVLHNLRRALPDADRFVEATPRTLQWRADAPFELDVEAFEHALARADRGGPDAVVALREAADAYTGNLLEGSYDDWVLERRELLQQRYLEALERLARLLEEQGAAAEAVAYAELLLRQDPVRESTYRLLMRLHASRGDRARALRVYHACAATLERELGVEPSAATREAYEALLAPGADAVAAQPQRSAGHPLVGRSAERARLAAVWREAARGRAQLVLVTGEPGIGKTRLLEELRAWCEHRGAVTAEARSYAAEGALAYAPVVSWLRSEGLVARRGRLEPGRLAELARLLPELELRPGAQREPLHETEQRQRLFDAIAAALAGGGPLLLMADDLHWADRETLQLLHYLLRTASGAPLLVAASARREELDAEHPLSELVAALQTLERVSEIELERLSPEETSALAGRIAGHALAEADADRLFAETEGNPLFVVEAVRAGLDRPGTLSPKAQATLELRLAQLSASARELAAAAAVLGREFSIGLLAAVAGANEETLVRGVDELWRRRIVRDRGAESYDFSHDKLREAAYGSLSPARRRRHHLAAARSLERGAGGEPVQASPQIASHYDRAGAPAEAAAWYAAAAAAALRVHAGHESIHALERALALVRTLPETRERDERELDLLTALVVPLGAFEGNTADRLLEAQERALELAEALAAEPPPLLRSLAVTTLSQGRFEEARDAGRRLQLIAERDGDDLVLVESQYVLGISAFWRGELAAARGHFDTAVARYRPEYRASHLVQYGTDPKVVCLSRLGNTLWFLGQAETAAQARDAALTLADEIGQPASRHTALVFAALLDLELRDEERLRARTAALRAMRGDFESTVLDVALAAFHAFVDVLDGEVERGVTRMGRMVEDARSREQAPGMQAVLLRLLLEACRLGGDARAGLAAAEERLAAAGPEALWESEVRRLRAEFLDALGGARDEVEAELQRALGAAARQEAKALELRAAARLARHHAGAGDARAAAAARRRLASVLAALPEAPAPAERAEAEALLVGD